MPKYWLDGIFDDPIEEEVEILQKMEEVIVPQSMTTDVSKTYRGLIVCKNFVYCDDLSCMKRHWYKGDYYCRKSRRRGQFEEAQKLDRFIRRYRGEMTVE